MSLDAIKVIKETEEQGEEIRRTALEKAREIVQQANAEAEDIHNSLIRKAQEDGENLLKQVRQETEQEIVGLAQDNAKLCQEVMKKAEGKLDEAAAFIMGRIVKSYGHS